MCFPFMFSLTEKISEKQSLFSLKEEQYACDNILQGVYNNG